MKRMFNLILIVFCVLLLVGCNKNDSSNKEPLNKGPLNFTSPEQVKQYFRVDTRVTATYYGFTVDVNVTPKKTVQVAPLSSCVVWVKVDYYYKVNNLNYTFFQNDFYIGVKVNLSSSGSGRGSKIENRGVVVVSAYLQNWYDVTSIDIKLLDY